MLTGTNNDEQNLRKSKQSAFNLACGIYGQTIFSEWNPNGETHYIGDRDNFSLYDKVLNNMAF